jgi:hypothetical protein
MIIPFVKAPSRTVFGGAAPLPCSCAANAVGRLCQRARLVGHRWHLHIANKSAAYIPACTIRFLGRTGVR